MGSNEDDKRSIQIGLIGMGEMGKLYATKLSQDGWHVNACDRPENYEALQNSTIGQLPNVTVMANGHLVSRTSDFIIYSVEAEIIDKIVALYGTSTKVGAIVGGQTSCKAPEVAAFEKHLPRDVHIIPIHSLHGPTVDTRGQPLVLIQHRASDEKMRLVERILSCFNSQYVYLTAEQHDKITADTQAATHAAFLSMGEAWAANNQFPWQVSRYAGGIENVKINVALRIYSNKWHVYAGLAILNPAAKAQIRQYAKSVTELMKLMVEQREEEFKDRVYNAGKFVFGKLFQAGGKEVLLRDDVLDQYSLSTVPKEERTPNNQLSLLAMVDCWFQLGLVPYNHMVCSTPIFRMWLGITEYVYTQPGFLDECIDTALHNITFRSDDLEFTFAARSWSDCVMFGNFEAYRQRFEKIQAYFEPRFEEAKVVNNEMLRRLATLIPKR